MYKPIKSGKVNYGNCRTFCAREALKAVTRFDDIILQPPLVNKIKEYSPFEMK